MSDILDFSPAPVNPSPSSSPALDDPAMDPDDEKMAKIATALKAVDGLRLELCGAWLWISGETKKHKDLIRSLGCRWAPKKMMWYWRPAAARCWYKNGRQKDIEDIRYKYGSYVIQ